VGLTGYSSSFNFAANAIGIGILITDSSMTEYSLILSAYIRDASSVAGTVAFADTNPSETPTASVRW
jgi:hypothetical protein